METRNLYNGKGEALGRSNYHGLKLTDQVMKLLEHLMGKWGINPLLFILVLEAFSCEFHTGVQWELLYADDLGGWGVCALGPVSYGGV